VDRLSKVFHIHILGDKTINGCTEESFFVEHGDFAGLSGPSGAGKSTILKCIYRTYLPTGGAIWYDSARYGKINLVSAPENVILNLRHREIGYVSQFLKVIPRVSALDVVAEPLLMKNGATPVEARAKAAALLERLHIPSRLFDAYPSTFSGGEQQRINIARAIIWKPQLLLLDEPTASLDRGFTAIVVELLRELRSEGTSMIGIFHDEALMGSIVDRTYRVKPSSGSARYPDKE
jgi:alpha-D-ribose 1-methylphosphonate 5-triphosphate synthase subunit PhnL